MNIRTREEAEQPSMQRAGCAASASHATACAGNGKRRWRRCSSVALPDVQRRRFQTKRPQRELVLGRPALLPPVHLQPMHYSALSLICSTFNLIQPFTTYAAGPRKRKEKKKDQSSCCKQSGSRRQEPTSARSRASPHLQRRLGPRPDGDHGRHVQHARLRAREGLLHASCPSAFAR
jgi:hypothetical protein